MLIQTGPSYDVAKRALPGEPIVALDAADRPVAIGVRLSDDPAARPAELAQFRHAILAHAGRVGDYSSLLSSALDVAADQCPEWGPQASIAGGIFAFAATGAGLVNAIEGDDPKQIAVHVFKVGIHALDLVDKFAPGVLPGLDKVVVFGKLAGPAFKVFVPKAG